MKEETKGGKVDFEAFYRIVKRVDELAEADEEDDVVEVS